MMLTCWDKRWDPIAMVTDKTVGIAMGMPGRYALCWIGYMTMISMNIPTAIEQIQKFPIAVKTCVRLHDNQWISVLMIQIVINVCGACQSCLLEVANLIGGVNKMCSLSKESVHTGCYDNSLDLTLLDRRTRVDAITRTFGGWQWLSSQGRL